jgi:hypothetical protein
MLAVFPHGHAFADLTGDVSGYAFVAGRCALKPNDVDPAERILVRFYEAQIVPDAAAADALQAEPKKSKEK